jgi:hypothetical protein
MFKKLIDKIKLFFFKRKLKKEFRIGDLVYQPETLMYYIVEAYVDNLIMLVDEYRIVVPVELQKVKPNYVSVKSVKCPENLIEYSVNHIDTINYTIELDGRGFVTLQDLNEGNF